MSVYDQAHLLNKELRESDEYRQYLEVKKEIEQDAATKKMLIDFQRRQYEIQSRQMMGQELSDEEKEQFQKRMEVVQMNKHIRNYLQLEQRLGTMLNDVQRIISDGLEFGFKEVFEGITPD